VGTSLNDDTVPASCLTDQPVQVQDLPLSAQGENLPLQPAQSPAGLQPGVRWSYYEGGFRSVSEVTGEPRAAGVAPTFTLAPRLRNSDYAMVFEGYVEVPADGVYTFYTASDDGSVLQVNGADVVDNDGLHSRGEESGVVRLQAGKHPIRVMYFQGPGDTELEVAYEGPGIGRQAIPGAALFHVAG
jgi:hypothetical protein